MVTRTVGVVMNGVTGRMGYRQHLVRSVLAIREQGGCCCRRHARASVRAGPGRPERATSCADSPRGTASSRVDDRPRRRPRRRPDARVYFDAQVTSAREEGVLQARSRPASTSTPRSRPPSRLPRALELADAARDAGVKTASCRTSCSCRACSSSGGSSTAASSAGSCPCAASSATGCSRATGSRRSGRPGTTGPRTAAASSLDMFPHWNYVLENLFGRVAGGERPGRHAHPAALGRAGASPTRRPPTTPRTASSSWTAASSRRSTPPGRCG